MLIFLDIFNRRPEEKRVVGLIEREMGAGAKDDSFVTAARL
jgi:hypothetical protein